MSFDSRGLSIGRGTYSNSSIGIQGQAAHTYITEDSVTVVEVASYFPDSLGSDSENVKINDLIYITSLEGTEAYLISSVSPFTLGGVAVAGDFLFEFAAGISGPFAAPILFSYTLRKSGNQVSLFIPEQSGAVTSSDVMTSGSGVGTILRPTADMVMPCIVEDNSSKVIGSVRMATTGLITFAADADITTPFQNSGNAGVGACVVTYITGSVF